ncbi:MULTISPECIES: YiiD C-terminal domain-containing protein [Parachlamydia]|jgi:thioesterase domain-containing protein|uniref:Thioesterase putative domain-containing protein n=2 Tax=Parachlamydia acanthamoebae TaxID=83552 RepID=F8L1D0_PARAV|nr:YiiD C-terminal domain-containing protein [Parachlamydia acanthamoebae]EFB40686.1 hypothetical protein pah_c197o075 [Parachlamydia acanthamoebae str. Hall's coccus]CCB87066.1 putative uncharacterized protein [Parachlamydia acanthamoebae UV-7]
MEKKVEAYLYAHIPITQAMGIKVELATPQKVILFAPLANNINHKKTVFGGSLHAVATLACWSLLYIHLHNEPFQIVITKSEVSYDAPVSEDFRAECEFPKKEEWDRFIKILKIRGKGRIRLFAKIYQKGKLCVDYHATFAVI